MNRPLSRLATRAAYGASQLPRIAWYLGHGLAMTRIARRAREEGSTRPRPIPTRELRTANDSSRTWLRRCGLRSGWLRRCDLRSGWPQALWAQE